MPPAASVATAVVSSSLVPAWFQFPILGHVFAGDTVAWSWVWRETDLLDTHGAVLSIPRGSIALSRGLLRLLSREHEMPDKVRLVLPESSFFEVAPALAPNVGEGAVVHIPRSMLGPSGSRHLHRWNHDWRLLIFDGLCAPVRVRAHDSEVKKARCGLLLRTLVGVNNGQCVQLASVGSAQLRRRADSSPARLKATNRISAVGHVAVALLAGLRRSIRMIDYILEILLRGLLRSPTVVVRSTQAPVGDDSASVVRLHPNIFASLGLRPGMQVVVSWCGIRVAAVALEDYEAYDPEASTFVQDRQAVERTSAVSIKGLPPHLVARVSLSTRRQLGIPAQTAVEVRRRLRPMVVAQLNQLTIPVAGIFLAGVAVPDLRWWPLVVGLVIVVVFGLAPLRQPRPPKGLWP
jgi:hypothetical protein